MDAAYDVVVVGGGAAGLSAGVVLSRSRRSVLVVDAGSPRNARAGGVHGYLGREGTPPGELLALGREELRSYGGEVVAATVDAVRPLGGDVPSFEVALQDGRCVRARRLVLATGLADELPDVPGVAERWGRDVLHCPYCHGWEVRDQRIGILATGPMAAHQALLFRQLSEHVTLLLHTAPQPADEQGEQLAARGVAVVDGEVAALEVEDDRLTGARLRSGTVVPLDAVVVAPRFTANAALLAPLGVELAELRAGEHLMGTSVTADATGQTSVPGLYVAGNVADLRAQVVVSAAAGLSVGAQVNADLVGEEARLAVAAAATSPAAWSGSSAPGSRVAAAATR